MSSDLDRQAVNERIATAMGYPHGPRGEWLHKDGYWRDCPPNFFTDPVAADELMRWLREHRYIVKIGTVIERDEHGETYRAHCVSIDRLRPLPDSVTNSDWMVALAAATEGQLELEMIQSAKTGLSMEHELWAGTVASEKAADAAIKEAERGKD